MFLSPNRAMLNCQRDPPHPPSCNVELNGRRGESLNLPRGAAFPFSIQHCKCGGCGGSVWTAIPLKLFLSTLHTRGVGGRWDDDDIIMTTSNFRPHREHDIFCRGGSQHFGLTREIMITMSNFRPHLKHDIFYRGGSQLFRLGCDYDNDVEFSTAPKT